MLLAVEHGAIDGNYNFLNNKQKATQSVKD